MSFPIDVSKYKPLSLDPAKAGLTAKRKEQLETNVAIVRDTIVFFTAIAGIKGYAGHTGGAYSIVPEVLIGDAFIRGSKQVYPVLFDEAGHRVAIQYAMSAFNGEMPFEKLFCYREYNEGLYGHPERDPELGVKFASGRLGHMWPFVNGVAKAHPGQAVLLYGSDGSQQEGNDAEAARFAVARGLNVKLLLDDNNVTISGHPQQYLPGYDLAKTLKGHGLTVDVGDGEDLAALYKRFRKAMLTDGPVALVNRRVMAPGIPAIEGSPKGHDVIKGDAAIQYLEARGHTEAVAFLNNIQKPKVSVSFKGSSSESVGNRSEFGKIVCDILARMTPEERQQKVLVVDSDLEGSCGLDHIHKNFPEVFVPGGVMERGNVSAAAGFGFDAGKQGIFATFSAFLEMVISEVTMARLNNANLLCHFSHAGVDEIADNTCHFGINNFLADSALPEGDTTRLYFPADGHQFRKALETIFNDPGIRFIFSNRSKLPYILKEDGSPFFGDGYTFERGKDDVIREGRAGYVVAYGELLYRALDAVERARQNGIDVGLINKATLNVVDESMLEKVGRAPFVLVVEGQNFKTGLGARYGTWLLERGLTPKYAHLGAVRAGRGGIAEQVPFQGLAPDDILAKIRQLNG
ncbi:MAG TPA: transketolase C-terminal domain-containing protein [Candidatus Hydrogenedentes bacterium]|jgi:transketolase|nr:transketolase C-terminal domain-containing protein [FCB group bacterium]HNZ18362.1 transketolase C-terminal domain-containing protein [Candidatus Hydrogenedentota bacterium]HOH33711.1 transketolase C-terminal domain-containing protein [Candidatus Hydrogenedentota bacterium]HPV37106.1 transketolase C-terminal domain-containing protein [Candidatus Hydrogenedentota bacterium]HQM32192.1 transketolase C-terminal domain-containing protein [Candidatus Hydrogenedentota bacterium]